jgi:hypothetical protein
MELWSRWFHHLTWCRVSHLVTDMYCTLNTGMRLPAHWLLPPRIYCIPLLSPLSLCFYKPFHRTNLILCKISFSEHLAGRSQYPCSLRHELSSPAQTLEPWIRIPLEAWMSVLCVFILCVPCDGLITCPRSRTDCVKDQETKMAKVQQKDCRTIERERECLAESQDRILSCWHADNEWSQK